MMARPELRLTSCSVERPPNTTPTLVFWDGDAIFGESFLGACEAFR